MTDHTLTITPVPDSNLITARCDCTRWAMVVPDREIAEKLHHCHLQVPPPDPPPVAGAPPRRSGVLRYADLLRMGAIMSKAQPFVTLPDWTPGALTDSAGLRARFAPPPEQLSLF